MIHEENENDEKYLTVETEDDFHEALKQGLPIEVTRELGEKIGLSFEDVGELGDIIEAHKDAYRSSWLKIRTAPNNTSAKLQTNS